MVLRHKLARSLALAFVLLPLLLPGQALAGKEIPDSGAVVNECSATGTPGPWTWGWSRAVCHFQCVAGAPITIVVRGESDAYVSGYASCSLDSWTEEFVTNCQDFGHCTGTGIPSYTTTRGLCVAGAYLPDGGETKFVTVNCITSNAPIFTDPRDLEEHGVAADGLWPDALDPVDRLWPYW